MNTLLSCTTKTRSSPWIMVILSFLIFINQSVAETMRTHGQALIEVYESTFQNSKILNRLNPGVEVTVIQTVGEMTQILIGEKTMGWVNSKLLVRNVPAEQELQSLKQEHEKIIKKLKITEQQLVDAFKAKDDYKKKIQELSSANKKIDGLQRSLEETELQLANTIKISEELNQDKSELESRMAVDPQPSIPNQHTEQGTFLPEMDSVPSDMIVPFSWYLVSIIIVFILGLLCGIAILDYRVRKRHRGIRIY